jgi:8-amino-7-oxononanoate synthase
MAGAVAHGDPAGGRRRQRTAMRVMAQLDARGLRVGAIRPPTVPAGTARLRIALSASHGEGDVARLVEALGEALAQPSHAEREAA